MPDIWKMNNSLREILGSFQTAGMQHMAQFNIE